MKIDSIAILDCGGQYTKVIDRRVRELAVRSEIFPLGVEAAKLKEFQGIILSGGPASVWAEERPAYDPALFELQKPILGICYGMHLINSHFGGQVVPGVRQEYGETEISIVTPIPLFKGLTIKQRVLMSHGDTVTLIAPGFVKAAVSDGIIAAISHIRQPIFGVQFHPEVDLTENGKIMLKNFLTGICELKGNYKLGDRIKASITHIREKVKDNKVVVLVSGGVDSAVTAAILRKALPPDQVYAIHVDHGLMRKGESDQICENLKKLNLKHLRRVNAEETFLYKPATDGEQTLGPLSQTTDPEEKRKIIGNHFIHIVKEACEELKLNFDTTFIAQGTLRPDLIESGNPDVSDYAHKIKTHHNDVDIIREARTKGLIVETNWDWHKDEVRKIARKLGIQKEIALRQPFPGPGLAIRYICQKEVEALDPAKVTEFITSFTELKKSFSTAETAADFTDYQSLLLPLKTVGVQGDCRSYRYLALLYGKGLAVDWSDIQKFGLTLPNKLNFVNRIAYVLNKKTIEGPVKVRSEAIHKEGLELLRDVDALVRERLDKPPVSQVFAVLLPLGITKPYSIAIRSFITNDYMTGRPAIPGQDISAKQLEQLTVALDNKFSEIEFILYDITGKPPATVEWE
jgi:GMP synthase (glutamine-hydrolysing)